jgi:hypothetical protein
MKKYTFEELWNRLPELIRTACEKSEQNKTYHAEGNVDVHIKLVFEYANNNYEDNDLLLAAIFHDLGKPETQRISEKDGKIRINNIGHETKCEYYINKYFDLYSDVSTNKEKVLEICNNHMRSHLYISNAMSKPSKRKSFEDLKYFEDILKFTECDNNGRIKK